MANMGFNFGIWTGTWHEAEVPKNKSEDSGLDIARDLAAHLQSSIGGKLKVLEVYSPVFPREKEYEIHRIGYALEMLAVIRQHPEKKPRIGMYTEDERIKSMIEQYSKSLPNRLEVIPLIDIIDELGRAA